MEKAPELTRELIDKTPMPPAGRGKKLGAGGGLSLLLKGGHRRWRMKVRFNGTETTLGLGVYPETSIEAAREAAREARRQINLGVNPAAVRRAEKAAADAVALNTFGKVGLEFLQKDDTKAPKTAAKHRWLYEKLERLHRRPLAEITAPELLGALHAIEAAGQREAAHRCAQFAARVFRHGINRGYCTLNPAANLRGELRPRKIDSHAGITDPKGFGMLMRFVDATGYGFVNVRHGLQLLARTFVRPGELRAAEWAEFTLDGENPEWKIPARRMKMKRPHLVPLSTQAVAIIKAQQEVTGDGPLVFPGRSGRPMSDGAMGLALKWLYDSGEHVPHGFRTSASILLNESGKFDSALIELQLSHAKRDKVAGIYDRSQRVPERRAMMQWWADYIDQLKVAR